MCYMAHASVEGAWRCGTCGCTPCRGICNVDPLPAPRASPALRACRPSCRTPSSLRRTPSLNGPLGLSSWHAVFLAYVFLAASWRPKPMAWLMCRLSRICACGSRDWSHDQGVRAVRHVVAVLRPGKGVSPLAPPRDVRPVAHRGHVHLLHPMCVSASPSVGSPAVPVGGCESVTASRRSHVVTDTYERPQARLLSVQHGPGGRTLFRRDGARLVGVGDFRSQYVYI